VSGSTFLKDSLEWRQVVDQQRTLLEKPPLLEVRARLRDRLPRSDKRDALALSLIARALAAHSNQIV
jgi:hypothetical protein